MNIVIARKRYVVVNDKNEIFCGLARNYHFVPINDIKDAPLKTYLSEKKAISSFLSSWHRSKPEDFESGKYSVVAVIESIIEADEGE